LQAALVNAGSNVLAQGIKAWRDQVRGYDLMLSYSPSKRPAMNNSIMKRNDHDSDERWR
jgi:hypothetical protein